VTISRVHFKGCQADLRLCSCRVHLSESCTCRGALSGNHAIALAGYFALASDLVPISVTELPITTAHKDMCICN
jgi:hypothetical protein